MKKKICFTISLTFSLLILTFPVAVIIYHKANGHLIDGWELTGYVSLFAFALSMVFVLIEKIPGMVKLILTFVILCGTAFLCVWMNGVGGYVVFESYNGIEQVERYNEQFGGYSVRSEDINKIDVPIESYGEFEDISHYYYFHAGIFQQVGHTTILKYGDGNFEKELLRVNSENTFHTDEDEKEIILDYEGFSFRLVSQDEEALPRQLTYIGVNEATREIAYVYSMYAIGDAVEDFESVIDVDCGWRYITEERTEK